MTHPAYPSPRTQYLYSLILAIESKTYSPDTGTDPEADAGADWRLGEFTVDWVDFTREKSVDKKFDMHQKAPAAVGAGVVGGMGGGPSSKKKASAHRTVPGASTQHASSTTSSPISHKSSKQPSTPDSLSQQPLLAHFPSPSPLSTSHASGILELGRGVVHLFRHAPPPALIAALDAHPVGEGSSSKLVDDEWAGEQAEGEDGSLIAILAVPAWMRPADFLEFIGGWGTCLEGVRMIREATTPNRSIVLLKFRDPLQAADFMVIFTGRAFSTLDARETCHPIRIHHLVLHRFDSHQQRSSSPNSSSPTAIPAFPPSIYASRVRELPALLKGIPENTQYELPSCPVCLERLDSTVTGLVTLPCAHTFDCDCLRKWGDSRCPVCRLSHLLLSSSSTTALAQHQRHDREITRLTKCSMCGITENNWICVVCGVVGCGRYEPGKGHARRHWEESGHVLAMELETQRVWDYKGDNYVHRLIQTKNDGKLVELPSASSLVTPSPSAPRVMPLGSRPSSIISTPERRDSIVALNTSSNPNSISASPAQANQQKLHTHAGTNGGSLEGFGDGNANANGSSHSHSGPSSNDIDKISTIESITLEYSYLLSSQLESMRQHYESQQSSLLSRLSDLETTSATTQARLQELAEAETARAKAERKAEKALELTRGLQNNLAAERSMTKGLSERIKALQESKERAEREKREREEEVRGLEETVRDLMFTLEAGIKVQEAGGEGGEGGDLVVVPGKEKDGKKGKKKK